MYLNIFVILVMIGIFVIGVLSIRKPKHFPPGITCTDGEHFNIQKNFLLKNFRLLRFDKDIVEEFVQSEINDVLNDLDGISNTRIGELIAPAVISALWLVITGSYLHRKDPELNKLLEFFERRAKVFDISGGILAQHPWLRFIAPEKTGYRTLQNMNHQLKTFFMKAIREHHETWSEEKDTDIIYSFISEMKKENSHHSFTDDQLLMLCLDLFIAGAKTTSGTLNYAFLMMLRHPDIQEKVHRVLDECLDKNQIVSYADRQRVPYVEAVLLEVERYCNLAPIIGPRRALKDANLEGYVIPKDATVLLHTYGVHMSCIHWKEPDKFMPERFLTIDGTVEHRDELLTFSLGRRKCIGEAFAKTFMFIFFTEMLRNCCIVEGSETKSTSTEGVLISAEFSAKFIKRRRS